MRNTYYYIKKQWQIYNINDSKRKGLNLWVGYEQIWLRLMFSHCCKSFSHRTPWEYASHNVRPVETKFRSSLVISLRHKFFEFFGCNRREKGCEAIRCALIEGTQSWLFSLNLSEYIMKTWKLPSVNFS